MMRPAGRSRSRLQRQAKSRPRPPFPWLTILFCAVAAGVYATAASGRPWPSVTGGGPVVLADPVHLVGLGARSTPLVTDAQEGWRLLTCHLVHTSTLHLGCNLLFIFSVGAALEQITRRGDYAALLVLCAVGSSLASLLWTPQVSAGASGLVFGLMGAAVVIGWRHAQQLGDRIRRYFGWWLLPFLLVLAAMTVSNPMVDHASHLGGLAAGMAAAIGMRLVIRTCRDPSGWLQPAAVATLAVVVLAAPALARRGHAPRRVTTDTGVTLEIPGTWHARYGLHGERQYATAGGWVSLTTELVPQQVDLAGQWYAEHRLRPTDPASRASLEHAPQAQLHVAGLHVWGARYRLVQHDVAMVRRVYFVRDPDGRRPITVISLQTPATWADKYDETIRRIVGSVRTSSDPTQAFSPSAAALK